MIQRVMIDSPTKATKQPSLRVVSRIFLILLAGGCIVILGSYCWEESIFDSERWASALIFLGVVTTLVTLSRDLPTQNLLLASFIVGLIALGFELLPKIANAASTPGLEVALIWPTPLIWVISILNARWVARIMLARWSTVPVYGFWLLGLATFLSILFIFGSQFLGKSGNHHSVGSPNQPSIWRGGVQGMNSFQVVGTAIIAGLLVSPSLVNKRPETHFVTAEPLFIWLSFNVLFVTGALRNQQILAAIVLSLSNILILSLASASRSTSLFRT
jgi:hypothetical protein